MVLWYVDELELFHVEIKELDQDILIGIKDIGKNYLLGIDHGLVHDYIRMRMDYLIPSRVNITIFNYIKGIIYELPFMVSGKASTPASNNFLAWK